MAHQEPVVQYEKFLFTRTKQRDFTAFVRPVNMSNKAVSVIARALNDINNIHEIAPEFPSLYLFQLDDYHLLLRHYNSGRKHAGREIGIIEGIAVTQANTDHLIAHLPSVLSQQAQLLNVIDTIPDLEDYTPTLSEHYDLDLDHVDDEPTLSDDDHALIQAFVAAPQQRLALPFTPEGWHILHSLTMQHALSAFAFGTNHDVVKNFAANDITFACVSLFNTTAPQLDQAPRAEKKPTPPPSVAPAPQPTPPPQETPETRPTLIKKLLAILFGKRD